MAYRIIPYEKLKAFCHELYSAYGFTEEEGRSIADVLLTADLFGIESHGVQRLVRYHQEMKCNMVNIGAKQEIVFETPISAVIDAHAGVGQLVSINATRLAIKKASDTGIGLVTVRNSNHYGIAGYYTKLCADEDMIGICMTNCEAIMVPTFGRQAMLGTDPIAVSMPADPNPFLFDAATTVVPRGKLEVYNKQGKPLPQGWVLDAAGRGSVDSGEVIRNIIAKAGGGILPLGGEGELNSGHKGYGFAMICELMTGIMAGGPTANHISSVGKQADISHCFWAIDYGIFGNKAEIKRNFSNYLNELRNSDKAEGQTRIYIHGEKELESKQTKLREGIPVNEKTLAEMRDIGGQMGIDTEKYFA